MLYVFLTQQFQTCYLILTDLKWEAKSQICHTTSVRSAKQSLELLEDIWSWLYIPSVSAERAHAAQAAQAAYFTYSNIVFYLFCLGLNTLFSLQRSINLWPLDFEVKPKKYFEYCLVLWAGWINISQETCKHIQRQNIVLYLCNFIATTLV